MADLFNLAEDSFGLETLRNIFDTDNDTAGPSQAFLCQKAIDLEATGLQILGSDVYDFRLV